jgi:hypothetical protein
MASSSFVRFEPTSKGMIKDLSQPLRVFCLHPSQVHSGRKLISDRRSPTFCGGRVSLTRPLAGLVIFLLYLLSSGPVYGAPQVEFIVDFSASMGEGTKDSAGTELVRGALREALRVLPADFEAAVRVYGHRETREQRGASCRDTELLIPFQRGLSPQSLAPLDQLSPRGLTPLAHAIAESAKDFTAVREERSIILITDGADTCDGDPVAVIRELQRRGFKTVVHTIGLNLTPGAREQLGGIAAVGGGVFASVGDMPSMRRGILKALKSSFTSLRGIDTSGRGDLDSPFDAANQDAVATVLPIGREFSPNHVGSAEDPVDVFRFSVKPGEKYLGLVEVLTERGAVRVAVFDSAGRYRDVRSVAAGVFEFDLLDITGSTDIFVRVAADEPADYRIKLTALVGLSE